MKTCFIIMPIKTPENLTSQYDNDKDHFEHVLDHLFVPAIKGAGLEPIKPIMRGADNIQAEIMLAGS